MKMLAFLLVPVLSGCLTGCLGGEATSEDGGFTGDVSGCADFVVLRESEDGRHVLAIEHYEAKHSGDTTYEVEVAHWAGNVRVSTYNRSGGMGYFHCNDVAYDGHPVRLSFRDAISGQMTIKVYGFTSDTAYLFSDSSHFFVSKDYYLNVELRDAMFDDGLQIQRVQIDSVRVGWFAG